METKFIKMEHVGEEQEVMVISDIESCLICFNQCDNPLQACWSIDIFKSLLGRESRSENECLSSHLLSIFILRKILNFPKAECEDLLRSMGVVHPGDWFRLCEDCSKVVERILESLKQIANLKEQISDLKKMTRNKLMESLRCERDSIGETITATISARNIIRSQFQTGMSTNSWNDVRKSTRRSRKVEELTTFKINPPNLCEIRIAEYVEVSDDLYFGEKEGGDDDGNFSPNNLSEGDVGEDDPDEEENVDDDDDDDDYEPSRKRKRSSSTKSANDISATTHKACDICGKRVKKSSIKSHRRRYHPREMKQRREEREKRIQRSAVPITCDICGKSPANEGALQNHMRTFHREIYDQRQLELKTSQDKSKFEVSGITYNCKKCDYTCFSEDANNYHNSQHRLVDPVVTKGSDNQLTCNLCSEVFPTLKEVFSHAKAKHGTELGVKSKDRSVSQDSRLGSFRVRDVITTKSETEFSCNFCGSIFHSLYLAARHAREKHRKEVRAGLPQYQLLPDYSLQKPYKCPKTNCTRSFLRPNKLRRHIKTVHDLIREYACEHCGKDFSARGTLNDHIAALHSEKDKKIDPQICDICGKEAPSQRYLQAHKRSMHPTEAQKEQYRMKNGPQNCAHCGTFLANNGVKRKHALEAHPELFTHMCSICPEKFMRVCGLVAHQKLKHSST